MTEQKLWQLIEKLRDKTASGEIGWEKTAKRNRFQAAFPKYVVQLSEEWGEENAPPDYFVTIYNESGTEIEKTSDVALQAAFKSLSRPGAPTPDAFKTLSALYISARRRALGVEEALDELLAELA